MENVSCKRVGLKIQSNLTKCNVWMNMPSSTPVVKKCYHKVPLTLKQKDHHKQKFYAMKVHKTTSTDITEELKRQKCKGHLPRLAKVEN